jgi:hypothetical protein
VDVPKGMVASVVVSEQEYLFAFCSREEDPPCHQEEKDSHLIQKTGRYEEEAGR